MYQGLRLQTKTNGGHSLGQPASDLIWQKIFLGALFPSHYLNIFSISTRTGPDAFSESCHKPHLPDMDQKSVNLASRRVVDVLYLSFNCIKKCNQLCFSMQRHLKKSIYNTVLYMLFYLEDWVKYATVYPYSDLCWSLRLEIYVRKF